MEAAHRRSGEPMDPLVKKIIIYSTIIGALSVIGSFVLSAATNIVRVKDAIEAVPVLQKTDKDFDQRLQEQERNNKLIVAWLTKFGEKWGVEPPKPWEVETVGRRRRGE